MKKILLKYQVKDNLRFFHSYHVPFCQLKDFLHSWTHRQQTIKSQWTIKWEQGRERKRRSRKMKRWISKGLQGSGKYWIWAVGICYLSTLYSCMKLTNNKLWRKPIKCATCEICVLAVLVAHYGSCIYYSTNARKSLYKNSVLDRIGHEDTHFNRKKFI